MADNPPYNSNFTFPGNLIPCPDTSTNLALPTQSNNSVTNYQLQQSMMSVDQQTGFSLQNPQGQVSPSPDCQQNFSQSVPCMTNYPVSNSNFIPHGNLPLFPDPSSNLAHSIQINNFATNLQSQQTMMSIVSQNYPQSGGQQPDCMQVSPTPEGHPEHPDEDANAAKEIIEQLEEIDSERIDFSKIASCTNNFSNEIGRGNFSTVYQGDLSGHPVAVKLLKDEIDKRFLNELIFLVRCKHENILSILGYSYDESVEMSKCCLIYEYMPNGSLLDRLACVGGSDPLAPQTRFQIAYSVALGLKYLHTFSETPIVHRDVKSANILLDKNFIPKLGDFGLVRQNSSMDTSVTNSECGTPAYMPPEAHYGEISVKFDSYSFGIVLYELLTGLLPYDKEREDKHIITLMRGIDDLSTMLDDKVDWRKYKTKAKDLYAIAKKCLKLVHERPTISDILLDLEKCCKEKERKKEINLKYPSIKIKSDFF